MLCLADIELDILSLAVLADDHARVYLFPGPYEQCTTLLGAVQSVSYGFAGLKCDEGALFAVLDIALVRRVTVEAGVQDPVSLCISEEFSAVADQTSGRDGEFQTGVSPV